MITPSEVLKATFLVWSRNATALVVLSFLTYTPSLIHTWLATEDPIATFGTEEGLLMFTAIATLLGAVATFFNQAIATWAGLQTLNAQPTSTSDVLRRGFASMGKVFTTALLAGLCVGLGLVAFVIPGIIIAMMFSAAVPVRLAEGTGAVAALKRSAQLTQGSRGAIFAALFALNIASIVVQKVLEPTSVDGIRVSMMATVVFAAMWGSLTSCLNVVVYHLLRTRKEGLDAASLAKVFD